MAKKPKMLNPAAPLIDQIIKMLMGRKGGFSAPLESYPGTLRAGQSPMQLAARNQMMQNMAGGGPRAWQNAQQFNDTYAGGNTQGVFNPFTSQIEQTMPQQGGGMGQGGGGGLPPEFMQMIMQMMQQKQGQGQPPPQQEQFTSGGNKLKDPQGLPINYTSHQAAGD